LAKAFVLLFIFMNELKPNPIHFHFIREWAKAQSYSFSFYPNGLKPNPIQIATAF